MIKFILSKIVRFFYRLLSKLIYSLMPIISRILIKLRLHSRIINQFNKLRAESHKIENYLNLVSKLLGDRKLVALDVGAQGGFLNDTIFPNRYNIFFSPIVVEPIPNEAKKLIDKNYQVISQGFGAQIVKKNYIF